MHGLLKVTVGGVVWADAEGLLALLLGQKHRPALVAGDLVMVANLLGLEDYSADPKVERCRRAYRHRAQFQMDGRDEKKMQGGGGLRDGFRGGIEAEHLNG